MKNVRSVSTMKQIIDTLKVKPCSKKELLSILREDSPQKSQEALRKECERSLKKLTALGLVEERGGLYCWYFYANDFKSHEDYNAKLLHSQKLVPALRRIAGIYVSRYSMRQLAEHEGLEDAIIHDECAENHLGAYPDIWAFFDDLRRIREKAESEKKQFNARLMQKLDTEFKGKLVKSSRGIKPNSFVMDNIPSLIYSQILDNRQSVSIEVKADGKILCDNILIAKGKKLSNRVKRFIKKENMDESNIAAVYRILEVEKGAFEAQSKLQPEVRKLIMRIEAGEPLLGGCSTCPRVYIRASTRKEL
jgi:hypothetical protein